MIPPERRLTEARTLIEQGLFFAPAAHVEAAKETLIQRRDTHLDSLVDKLREDRVRRVIEPILAGTTMAMDTYNDDLVYVRDLGLVETRPNVRIANPIYQEVIPRSLTTVMQVNISHEAVWYTRPDGSLDLRALLRAFQEFFAEGYLLLFDRRPEVAWEAKLFEREIVGPGGRRFTCSGRDARSLVAQPQAGAPRASRAARPPRTDPPKGADPDPPHAIVLEYRSCQQRG